MGESRRMLAFGRFADRDVERGRLGAEDPAVLGAVDRGDVDAVLDVGPGGSDLEAGDGTTGLLGFGDDVLGDQATVGRRGREPGRDLEPARRGWWAPRSARSACGRPPSAGRGGCR